MLASRTDPCKWEGGGDTQSGKAGLGRDGGGMGLNSAILINVARSTLHGHPSIERAGSFNRVETFHVNYFPVELGLHGHERSGEGWTLGFFTLERIEGRLEEERRGHREMWGKFRRIGFAILENFERKKRINL